MDLKSIQEAYDNANFSDEMKKVFPRPETEEDLERFNKTVFTPIQGFGSGWGMGLLGFLLGTLLCSQFGFWDHSGVELLKSALNESENQKID